MAGESRWRVADRPIGAQDEWLIGQILGVKAVSDAGTQIIPVDLCRCGQRYVLSADLPGVDPGSIKVIVDRGALTIKARRLRRSAPTDDWITNECVCGTLERRVILSESVDSEHMQVGYHHGVLVVSIPLADKPTTVLAP